MRSPRWLLASLMFVPSLASAQVYLPVPPPPPLPPPPPHVYLQQRIHWHLRKAPPPVVVAPAAPPVWVAPAAPPPPVYYSQPPLVHIEPQQPIPAYPQPTYQQPPCCVQVPPPPAPPVVVRPAPVTVAPVVVAQRAAAPQWAARFGLGATVEGTFGRDDNASRGYGVAGQLRYRTSRHTALELMGGYQRATYQSGIERQDVPVTFGLVVPFLGPEHAFSPYLVGALGLNFARLRLVDSPDFRLDDSRLQGVAQLGGGFELRLGQHLSLNTDARLEGRWNANDPSADVQNAVVKVNGQVVDPLKNSVGVRLGLGATIYF